MNTYNPNCDGSVCKSSSGEVRVLPTGGGGNLILCRACYGHEMAYRRERNRRLAGDARFDIPAWESLAVYEVDDDQYKAMRAVKVTFKSGRTLETNINGTKEDVRRYYVGESFTFGTGEGEDEYADTAVSVEFID